MPYNQTSTLPTTTPRSTARQSITRRTTSERTNTRSATKRLLAACSSLALMIIMTSTAYSQNKSELAKFIAAGQQQLIAARTTNTEEGYHLAETTFERAVQLDAKEAIARVYLGLARMELSGWIARQGRFGPSGEIMNRGVVDLDAAVALGPDNLQGRMLRRASY